MMEVFFNVVAVERRMAQIAEVPLMPAFLTPKASVPSKGEEFSGLVAGAAKARALPASSVPLADMDRLITASADAAAVDKALIKAIIRNESGFQPNATSPTNAQGLMQLEPATAAGLGVADPYDPEQNVRGGTRYLKTLLDRFHGDLRLAIAAYNSGPGAVEKYGGVPPYVETQRYVANVLESYRQYKAHER